jgi:hypothetical protein
VDHADDPGAYHGGVAAAAAILDMATTEEQGSAMDTCTYCMV